MNKTTAQRRMKQLHEEVSTKQAAGTLTHADMDRIEAEYAELEAEVKRHTAGAKLSAAADMYPSTAEAATVRKGVKWRAPSPLHASEAELKNLYESARHGLPYRLEVSAKGIPTWDGVNTKTALTESGFGGIPPVLLPQAFNLPYDPTRLWEYLPVAGMPGPTVEYLQHTGNANPGAVVAEGATKPDIGLQLAAKTASAVKLAALASVSMEALQDFESFMGFVPTELTRAIIDAETNEILNGSGDAPHPKGILNTTGILTRAKGTDTPLDTIQKAFDDLRVGSSFAVPSIVVLHPSTWSYLRREKNTLGSYLLAPDPSTGQVESIWGVPVVVTTKIAVGTGLIMDTAKAVQGWVRMGLTIELNRYGTEEWTKNLVSFRAEERIAVGVTRPTAIIKVTGLGPETAPEGS